MNDAKQKLATAVREARTGLKLSQEKLAEILNIDKRTILKIEARRSNPQFEKLYPIIAYLNIPTDNIFHPGNGHESPNLQRLTMVLSDCSEEEAKELLPAVRYLLNLMRKSNT